MACLTDGLCAQAAVAIAECCAFRLAANAMSRYTGPRAPVDQWDPAPALKELSLPSNKPSVDRTILSKSGLQLSRIGLGLAHMHLLSSLDRRRLLERALELQITHFDTSRFYSDGLSERTLGEVFKGRRDKITITTKFGLIPTPLIGSLGIAAPPFRKARAAFNKLGIMQYPNRSYTRASLRRSLQDSLRALRTDYIDIYCLHEPLANTTVSDDLLEELEQSKVRGEIKLIGVAGAEIDAMVSRFGPLLDVIQSAEASWSEDRFVPDITHSLFSGAVRDQRGHTEGDSLRPLLERALGRRRNGSVIIQTRHLAHLDQFVGWAAGR